MAIIFVGNVEDIPGAAKDERRIHKLLTKWGFDVTTYADTLAEDFDEVKDMLQALTRPPKVLWLYYVGHGNSAKGKKSRNYLFQMADRSIFDGGAFLDDVFKMQHLAKTAIVTILDCCLGEKPVLAPAVRGRPAYTRFDPDVDYPENTFWFVAATRIGYSTRDEGSFSQFFAATLEKMAWHDLEDAYDKTFETNTVLGLKPFVAGKSNYRTSSFQRTYLASRGTEATCCHRIQGSDLQCGSKVKAGSLYCSQHRK